MDDKEKEKFGVIIDKNDQGTEDQTKVDESRFMRGGIRLAFDDDRFGGKKMSIIMNTGVLDIPNSQHRNFLALMRGISEKDFK